MAQREIQANDRAVERLALSKEVLARALGPSVVGNVADFVDIDADGMPHPNFAKATYEQMAVIKSIVIEEFLDHGNRTFDEATGKRTLAGSSARGGSIVCGHSTRRASAAGRRSGWSGCCGFTFFLQQW